MCRTWFSADLWLTASVGLHLCLLSLDLFLILSHRTACFAARPSCIRFKLALIWLTSQVTALGPLLWHYLGSSCGGCVPASIVIAIVSSCLCCFGPAIWILATYAASVGIVHHIRQLQHPDDEARKESEREREIENLKQVVHNFTSISADVDIHSILSSEKEEGFTRRLSLMSSRLSRRLSSKRHKQPSTDVPSSPKLDRHPSLRYSIKRNIQRRPKHEEKTHMAPLLAPMGDTSVSADSLSGERTPEELDDQTICHMLLAESPSGHKRRQSSRRRGSSKRRSKKLSSSSPTLDRHPSLRYSIKRPRTPLPDEGQPRGGSSFKRSPGSQHSFFSRTPSQRSNVSRTPSQRQHSPFAAGPAQSLKMTPLTPHPPTSIFNFPEQNHCAREEAPLLVTTDQSAASELQDTDITHLSSNTLDDAEPHRTLPSPVLVLQTATPTKHHEAQRPRPIDSNGQKSEVLGGSSPVPRANSIESLEDGVLVEEVSVDPAISAQQLQSNIQLYWTLGALAACYVVTHLPAFVTLILENVCQATASADECGRPRLYFGLQWLQYASSLLNPAIFFAFHRDVFQRLRQG